MLAEKNPRMDKKVSSTSLPQHTSRASLVSAEKNHVRYFLRRVVIPSKTSLREINQEQLMG
jgi:hypothetical protein